MRECVWLVQSVRGSGGVDVCMISGVGDGASNTAFVC